MLRGTRERGRWLQAAAVWAALSGREPESGYPGVPACFISQEAGLEVRRGPEAQGLWVFLGIQKPPPPGVERLLTLPCSVGHSNLRLSPHIQLSPRQATLGVGGPECFLHNGNKIGEMGREGNSVQRRK